MTKKYRVLPKTASVAHSQNDGKLHAPSAIRNIKAILPAITPFMPKSGCATEIASGTGEHILRYAQAFPDIIWQPTDIDTARLTSIKAWALDAGHPNILAPKHLDAATPGWARDWPQQDAIILCNLLHLISAAEAAMLLAQATRALAPNGVFLVYGPFLRGSEFASNADREFHKSLHSHHADIGYKSFEWVQQNQAKAGLTPNPPIEMPANNLLLVARKGDPLGTDTTQQ